MTSSFDCVDLLFSDLVPIDVWEHPLVAAPIACGGRWYSLNVERRAGSNCQGMIPRGGSAPVESIEQILRHGQLVFLRRVRDVF